MFEDLILRATGQHLAPFAEGSLFRRPRRFVVRVVPHSREIDLFFQDSRVVPGGAFAPPSLTTYARSDSVSRVLNRSL